MTMLRFQASYCEENIFDIMSDWTDDDDDDCKYLPTDVQEDVETSILQSSPPQQNISHPSQWSPENHSRDLYNSNLCRGWKRLIEL